MANEKNAQKQIIQDQILKYKKYFEIITNYIIIKKTV